MSYLFHFIVGFIISEFRGNSTEYFKYQIITTDGKITKTCIGVNGLDAGFSIVAAQERLRREFAWTLKDLKVDVEITPPTIISKRRFFWFCLKNFGTHTEVVTV